MNMIDDDEDEDEPRNQRKSSRRVTIASPLTTPKPPGKKSLRISTPGPSTMSAYSSAEEDDDENGIESIDQVNELPGHSSGVFSRLNKSIGIGGRPSAIKSPKSVTPTAQGMPKARTSTPMTKAVVNTSVFGNSSVSSSSIGRRTSSRSSGSRIPSSLRVEPPSASSLASFSDDNDSENELGSLSSNNTPDTSSANLLRYRPRSSGIVRGSKMRTPLANITTQANDYSLDANRSIWSSFFSSSTSATSSPSSWISISILIVALIFFISIFSFYFYSRITSPSQAQSESSSSLADKVHKVDEDGIILKLNAPICLGGQQSDLHLCLESKERVRPALQVINQVALMFEEQCIKHYCGPSEDKSAKIADPSVIAVDYLRSQLVLALGNSPSFLKLARESIKLDSDSSDEGKVTLRLVNKAISDCMSLLERNPRFKINVMRDENNKISHLKIDLKTFPIHWPWMCRFTMAVIDAVWILCILSVVMFISFCLYYFINLNKKRRSEEEELKYELIEKSLELLQSPDEPQSMPILHIRDTLISPLDRTDSKNIRVWSEVVKFIEENESRVKIDNEVIDGETYRTWKWVASPISSDGFTIPGSIKTGDIEWQGQAFNENDAAKSASPSSRRSSFKPTTPTRSESETFVAPTCFIKARNLFDIEAVRNNPDSSWQTPIMDAILQKCSLRGSDGDHGILHIVFDSEHGKEALVYMRCRNIESATNAYLALHGWWCERKLVSVRFLKDDRYYQRFPEARNCYQSLKCSSEV